jgi:SynChlorMet cassette protein ScmC
MATAGAGLFMSIAGSHNAYSLVLSNGTTWGIGPCEGADFDVVAWVNDLVAYLGLEGRAEEPACSIRFGRARDDGGHFCDSYPSFVSRSSAELPIDGWRVWGRAGAVLMSHPALADVFCGLYSYRAPVIEQMRHALIPILEETITSGGVPIHGALVEREGVGALLLGRSGAGKSTSCGRLPPPWRVHGDDMALGMRNAAGQFMGHPLPTWSAVESGNIRWPCRAGRAVSVRGLFLLEKSSADSVEPLEKAMAALLIEKAAREALKPFLLLYRCDGAVLRRRIFENAVALAATVPAFRLRVSLDGCFWRKIEEALGAGR